MGAITRSPLTGTFLDSYGSGAFAGDLARALRPCYGVADTGRAAEPQVLVVENGTATFRPAGDLWGRDVAATAAALEGSVATVGPAGENRVRYGTIVTGGGTHHAGRGGARGDGREWPQGGRGEGRRPGPARFGPAAPGGVRTTVPGGRPGALARRRRDRL